RSVEGSFDSILAAYHHKLDRLPERDPGERLKLAQWCLNLRLTAEAKDQLSKVLELSPGHGPAQAMIAKINRSNSATAGRTVDPDVQRTRVPRGDDDRPEPLDSAVMKPAHRGIAISELPAIFDLPQPLAIRRADEFTRVIHPMLQSKCARCHNGNYRGEFQLVPVSSRRDQTPDALRANLEATLRLIDPLNPSRSELL